MTTEPFRRKMSFRDKVKAWLVAARIFVIPWMIVNTFLGATLAGFDLWRWIAAFTAVSCVLLSGHFINAWRDFIKGIDSVKNGSKEKPYSSGNQILPLGLLSVRTIKASAAALLLLSFMILFSSAPNRPDVFIIYLVGVVMALTYTDFFKPKGFGEIALFLGHGIGATAFAYTMIAPFDVTALSIGVLLGFWSGIIYTLDQYQDLKTDFQHKIKNVAQIMFKANIRVSQLWYFLITASITMQVVMVIFGWIPLATLGTIFLLPMGHIVGIFLDYNFDKGVIYALFTMWLYALVAALGVWLYQFFPSLFPLP